MAHFFKHMVIDGFLPEDLHQGLLEYTLQNRGAFQPSEVIESEGLQVVPGVRVAWRLEAGLGPFKRPFKDAVRARFEELVDGLSVDRFDLLRLETELAAHRDGAFYLPHMDTAVQGARPLRRSDRIISLVYYFHALPRRFTGGELALLPLGKGEPQLIEPRDNRLLAFPSFALHEVKRVHCAPDDFAHARFAVNCWLHRSREQS